jgi:hypothetical protein
MQDDKRNVATIQMKDGAPHGMPSTFKEQTKGDLLAFQRAQQASA